MKFDPEFELLLPKLKKKLFSGKVEAFGVQKYWLGSKEFKFDWVRRHAINQDFIDHFYRNGLNMGNYIEGAIGLVPLQSDGTITKVTIDCDAMETREFCLKEVVPKCEKLGIDYLIEHSGNIPFDRLHYVFFVNKVPAETVKQFFRQFFAELGEPILAGGDEKFLGKPLRFDEVYGVNRAKNLCRLEGGFNVKPERNRRYPVEYRGDDLDDPLSILKAMIAVEPITEDFMKSYIKEDFFPAKVVPDKIEWKSETLRYDSLNLPLPVDYIPKQIKPIFENCQALNQILNEAHSEGLIEKAGQKHHDAGFALVGPFRYMDVKFHIDEGRKAWDRFKADGARLRDDKGHNWWHGDDKQPSFYVWKCESYDKYFDRCEGCPFRGRVNSPRDFTKGKEVKKQILDTDNRLVTIDHVRSNTLPEIKDYIKGIIKQNLAFDNV